MTWQDELRRLDEELAAGRLSAEEYRHLRDGLLGAGGGQPGQEAGEVQGADEERTERSPFPPPFKWEQSPTERTQMMPPVGPDAGPGSEATQVVRGQAIPGQAIPGQAVPGPAGDDADRTQVVGGRAQPPPAASDAERTQVVPSAGHPPQGGHPEQHFPSYGGPPPGGVGQAPPWQPMPSNAPPWVGSDLPPHAELPPAWLRQGPEDFAVEPRRSGALRVLTIIGAVVLLAGISVGAYFLFRPDPNATTGPTTQASAKPTTTTAVPTTTAPPTTTPAGPPIADLPGTARDMSQVTTFTDVEALNYLTPEEIAAYKAGAAAEVKMAVSMDGDNRVILLITKQRDLAAANTARDALGQLQVAYHLVPLTLEAGVLAGANDAATDGRLRRAHYAAESYVVRIEVLGKNADQAQRLFEDILGAQLDELPPNV